jgi:hypothetical protein
MRVVRTLTLALSAVALSVSLVAAVGTSAASAATAVAATGSFKCTSVSGKTSYAPALTTSGDSSSITSTVKLTLSGCTISGTTNVTTGLVGKAKGSFILDATNADNCASSPTDAGSNYHNGTTVNGSLTIDWKAKAGKDKLLPSVVSVSARVRGTNDGSPATYFGGYQRDPNDGDGTATIASGGSFAVSATEDALGVATSSETTSELLAACGSKKGVKKVAVGSGVFEGGSAYVSSPIIAD